MDSVEEPVKVRRAVPSDLDLVVPLFDAYRQFYRQPGDLEGARLFYTRDSSATEITNTPAQSPYEKTGWIPDTAFRVYQLSLR